MYIALCPPWHNCQGGALRQRAGSLEQLTLPVMVPRNHIKKPSCLPCVRQVGALQQRAGSLEALTLRACDLMDHDPDMPLIFDLRPLALVRAHLAPRLTLFLLLLRCWEAFWCVGAHSPRRATPFCPLAFAGTHGKWFHQF